MLIQRGLRRVLLNLRQLLNVYLKARRRTVHGTISIHIRHGTLRSTVPRIRRSIHHLTSRTQRLRRFLRINQRLTTVINSSRLHNLRNILNLTLVGTR